MSIKKFVKSDKKVSEKSRILYFRLKKKSYSAKTKIINNKFLDTEFIKISNSLFYFNEKSYELFSDGYKLELIKEANRYLNNQYRNISGDILVLPKIIDWNKDYVFDHKWKLTHFSEYNLKEKDTHTDIKHVWELSRFYHLVILAQAYTISSDEKYVDKIKNDILSWVKQNPCNYSVNWTVAMEVAIRVVNLIQTVTLIKSSKNLDENFIKAINNFIKTHGDYIWHNLEKGITTNNHYLSNLIGLIWIAIYFRGSSNDKLKRISQKYLKFSIKQLKYELNYQINKDGLSYEDSLSYHGLNTEMLLLTINILDRNNIKYPNFIKIITVKMVESLNELMVKNRIPVIGDIDNGRLILCDILANRDKTNFGYLIEIAKRMKLINENDQYKSPIQFHQSGFYRIFNEQIDVVIRCGKIGLNGVGGHSHNDQLSFVLNVLEEQIIVDSGTGYYSGDYHLRRLLRSTESHNTLCIKDSEQNNIDIDLFKMIEKTNSKLLKINNSLFEGMHSGFLDTHGIEYKRRIEVKKGYLYIHDQVNKLPDVECFVSFILDSDVKIIKSNNFNVELMKNELKLKLEIDSGHIKILDHFISKSYGKTIETKKIKVIMGKTSLKTIIKIN
jgi:hypothetical protein